MDKGIDRYRAGIRVAMSLGQKLDGFRNPDMNHTIAIDEEFLKNAKEEVYILCNKLAQDVWCDDCVVAALDVARKNNVKIELITRDDIDGGADGNAFFQKLKTFPEGKVSYKKFEAGEEVKPNILCVDKQHYRVEPEPIDSEGKPNRAGFAGVYSPKVAGAWEKEFHNASENAKEQNGLLVCVRRSISM